ncbi:MAG TPA: TlpA disulfide reductase family protein [Roseiflexaceae bacterium]|nr:TlpA disulfide reductase family protein [Roseiflexaceae bacterium]
MSRQIYSMLVLAALLLASCGQAATPATTVPAGLPPTVAVSAELVALEGGVPRPGEPAPDFRYRMVDGGAHSLSELRGRKVLVNFWATWCAPCKEEMPDLQRLADEYGERLAVLGVNKLETLEAIGPFASDLDITFTLVPNPEGDIAERYGAKNLPLTYFINSDGTIGYVHIGVLTYDEAKAQIERLR